MKHLILQNITFQKQLDAFVKRLQQQGKPVDTVRTSESHVKEFLHFMESLGVEEIGKITQAKIDKFMEYLVTRPNLRKSGGLSPGHINKNAQAILRFMEFVDEVGVGKSRFEIKQLPKTELNPKDILSKEEIQRLFDTSDNSFAGITDKCILSLLYGCGLRKDELYQLEVADIDFVNHLIRLDHTKTKQERDVPMSPSVQRLIEQYIYSVREAMLPVGSSNSFLIISERGDRMDKMTISWRIKRMTRRAGIEKRVYPHLFRHSIGSHLADELSIEEIAVFLGHKCIDSTAIYVRINEHLKSNAR